MLGSEPYGYCSQERLFEEGVSALLTANISKCFSEYCHYLQLQNTFADRVSIMHQSGLKSASRKAEVDISLYYRFLPSDPFMNREGLQNVVSFAIHGIHQDSQQIHRSEASTGRYERQFLVSIDGYL